LGLKESKEMIEKLPALVKKDMAEGDMTTLKEKLEAIGCQIQIS
jgi:ribosomal protein L7/L12